MSGIVASFNPATSSTNEFSAPNSAANGALVFFNESNVSIDLTFADGSSMYLPAWYHRHKCGYSGSVNVAWDVRQVLSSNAPPISQVIVEAFAQGEHFPADGPLVRQANVGNTINTVGGTANSVQNDGNAANTTFIESTVGIDAQSAVTLSNGGVLALGNNVGRNGQIFLNGPASKLTLNVGSISKISKFTALVNTTPTFFNHGLGVIPDFVVCVPDGTGAGPFSTQVDYASLTTSQAKLTGSASFNTQCLAIKF